LIMFSQDGALESSRQEQIGVSVHNYDQDFLKITLIVTNVM
jgi:hypothetical protein